MKSRSDCDICDGSGEIRFPVRQRFTLRSYATVSAVDEFESARTYPCPECSETVKQEQLFVVVEVAEYDAMRPEFKFHAAKHAAKEMIAALLDRGYIALEVGQHDPARGTIPVRAKLGVVSPRDMERLEERVVAHQETIANAVIERAAQKIDHYGSHYGHESVPKSVAKEALGSALRTVLERREMWTAVALEKIERVVTPPPLSGEKERSKPQQGNLPEQPSKYDDSPEEAERDQQRHIGEVYRAL